MVLQLPLENDDQQKYTEAQDFEAENKEKYFIAKIALDFQHLAVQMVRSASSGGILHVLQKVLGSTIYSKPFIPLEQKVVSTCLLCLITSLPRRECTHDTLVNATLS